MTRPQMPNGPTGATWIAATAERNWLITRLTPKRSRDGFDKPPLDPVRGGRVSLHDAAKLTFTEAAGLVDRLNEGREPRAAGRHHLGYLARPGSAMVPGDLDGCAGAGGALAPWAVAILGRGSTYAELSPSGRGVRVLLARHERSPEVTTERAGAGLYGDGMRFATVTLDGLRGRGREIVASGGIEHAILERIDAARRRPVGHLERVPAGDAHRWFDRLPEADQLHEVERMLAHLTDPGFGDYEPWLLISFSVYAATDSMGHEIWDHWCAQLPGYDADENLYKWGTFYRQPGLRRCTVGTLIAYARARGYQPPLGAARTRGPSLHASELDRIIARSLAGRAR